jgi:hypothetical protein
VSHPGCSTLANFSTQLVLCGAVERLRGSDRGVRGRFVGCSVVDKVF